MIPSFSGRNKKLEIECKNEKGIITKIVFDPLFLNYNITVGNVQYKSSGRKPFLRLKNKNGSTTTISFENALVRNHNVIVEFGSQTIVSEYSWFHNGLVVLPFSIRTGAKLYNNGMIRFFIEANNELDEYLDSVLFPQALNFVDPATHAHSIEPIDEGALVFDNHFNDDAVKMVAGISRSIGSPLANMPFYARVNGESGARGYLAIIDTPTDAALYSSRGYSSSFLTSTLWKASLGKLAYRRSVTYRFFEVLDYNIAAKTFREYIKENGLFKSIDEKISEIPSAKDAAVSPIVNAVVCRKIEESSALYKDAVANNEEISKTFFTFADVDTYANNAKAHDFKSLTFQLKGWGAAGADNKHPSVLPVCEKAGGAKGLADLKASLKDKGYFLSLVDQYHDFYANSPAYDESLAVAGPKGIVEYDDSNNGGKQAFLRADKAISFAKANYEGLSADGIKPDFVTLDSATTCLDESFNADAPMTRTDSFAATGALFQYFNNLNAPVFGSDQGGLFLDKVCLMNVSDLETVGVPVPLYDLVYHDSLAITCEMNDSSVLKSFLCARVPSFSIDVFKDPDSGKNSRLLSDVKKLTDLIEELYNVELISHVFLDPNRTKEQTKFANGVTITTDFANNTCKIEK